MSNAAQKTFDDRYITSSEISKVLGISRAAVSQGIGRGLLPNPISINNGQLVIFERDAVKPYLEFWSQNVGKRIKNA